MGFCGRNLPGISIYNSIFFFFQGTAGVKKLFIPHAYTNFGQIWEKRQGNQLEKDNVCMTTNHCPHFPLIALSSKGSKEKDGTK